jgi:AcrR family transcriptional regulator
VVAHEAEDGPRPTRTRRPSAEVRKLILDAAQGLFAANGYRGTSTREIADRAGVAEVLLFRNFGSKAELYSTSVVLPLIEFLNGWITSSTWDWDEADTELRQREFTAQLYEVARGNRGLIVSYLAMSVFEPDLVAGLEHSKELDEVMDRLADLAGGQLGRLGRSEHSNPRVGTRAVIGMILSMALFDDLGVGSQASKDEVIDEMTQIVLHGALHRPGPPPRPKKARTSTRATAKATGTRPAKPAAKRTSSRARPASKRS